MKTMEMEGSVERTVSTSRTEAGRWKATAAERRRGQAQQAQDDGGAMGLGPWTTKVGRGSAGHARQAGGCIRSGTSPVASQV